jgi:hypothetical protein
MSPKDVAAPFLAVYRPKLATAVPRGRVLVVGASGQVRSRAMSALHLGFYIFEFILADVRRLDEIAQEQVHQRGGATRWPMPVRLF